MARDIPGKDWISVVDKYIKYCIMFKEVGKIFEGGENELDYYRKVSEKMKDGLYDPAEDPRRILSFYSEASRDYYETLRRIGRFDSTDLYEPINHLTTRKSIMKSRLEVLEERYDTLRDLVSKCKEGTYVETLNETISDISSEMKKISVELSITDKVLNELTEKKEKLSQPFNL